MADSKLDSAVLKYGGVELNLTKSPDQGAVQYTPAAHTPERVSRDVSGPPSDLHALGFEVFRASGELESTLDDLRQRNDVSVGTHVWHVEGEADVPFVPTGKLYIEFTPGTTPDVQQDTLEEMHLSVLEVVADGAYRVTVTPASPNPVKCAIILQERTSTIAVAEPEFQTRPTTNDFVAPAGRFITTQWHLENSGSAIPVVDLPNSVYAAGHFRRGADARVKQAWEALGNLGSSNIRIAVIDTGFATDHPQLRGNGSKLRTPLNAVLRTADVSPWFQAQDGSWGVFDHGTSCAAVAAGALDAQGIMGAAPNARLILIKLDLLTDEAIKTAFEHALLNGADIISCSLGFPKPVPLSTYVTNYLRKVAREGRNGKGIPMFFAAGNANPASNFQPRQISDFAAHPEGICITASNSLDERSDYSFYGPNAHNCAPSNGGRGAGITTATVRVDGNNRMVLGYTSGFGGTSSAAPLAAGICALMMSANPDLTLSEIKNIFRQSADKIGGEGAYSANGHSQFYGYGRLNAGRAVQIALQYRQQQQQPAPPTPKPTVTPSPVPAPVTQPATAETLKGRVLSKFLNVRTGPATSFPVSRRLNQGDVVNLLERHPGWWQISASEFVSADYIQVVSSVRKGRVIYSFLNVRSGPGVSNAKVGQLSLGQAVDIYETTPDGWYRIGDNRWVLGKYVQII